MLDNVSKRLVNIWSDGYFIITRRISDNRILKNEIQEGEYSEEEKEEESEDDVAINRKQVEQLLK